jgi:hypothetical protein
MALRRAGIAHFGVSGMLVWVASGHRALVLPGPVQEWILNYDYGMQMTPIDFDLHLPDTEEAPVPVRQVKPGTARQASPRTAARPTAFPARVCRPKEMTVAEPVGK